MTIDTRRWRGTPALSIALLVAACGGESEAPRSPGGEGGSGEGGGGTGGEPAPPSNFDAAAACTTAPQTGCAPTHTCAVATLDGRTACQGAGSAPPGAYCGADYDCSPGLVCISSICHAQCLTPEDCGGVAQACEQIFSGGTEQPIPGYLTCSTPCNPADPTNAAQEPSLAGCAAGLTCYPRDTPTGSTECYAAGSVGLGGLCDSDCAPGLVCLGNGTTQTCQPFCVMDLTACSCQPFAEPSYVGIDGEFWEVGYCG